MARIRMRRDDGIQTLGARIERLRVDLNMRSIDLAKKVGITQGQISNYENDKQIPSAYILYDLSRVLEASIEYLLFGHEDSDLTHAIKKLPEGDQQVVRQIITSLHAKHKLEKLSGKPLMDILQSSSFTGK